MFPFNRITRAATTTTEPFPLPQRRRWSVQSATTIIGQRATSVPTASTLTHASRVKRPQPAAVLIRAAIPIVSCELMSGDSSSYLDDNVIMVLQIAIAASK